MQMAGDEIQTEDELHRVPAAESRFMLKCQCVEGRLISSYSVLNKNI